MSAQDARIRALRRARPRDRFVRTSVLLLLALAVGAWFLGDFDFRYVVGQEAAANLSRFAAKAVPPSLRDGAFSGAAFGDWVGGVMEAKGWRALGTTLAISVLAIALAGVAGLLLAPLAARTLATPEPYVPGGRRPSLPTRGLWALVVIATRAGFVLLRALPEYVWAFLLFTMLGQSAWPAVLALAVHNAGILGRLGADTLENARREPLAALRGLGGTRAQITAFGAGPEVFGRFLLYFFYRWETCVREATVLGMVGIVSLGYFIDDAVVRRRFGEMLLLILLGSALVVLGDIVSTIVRGVVRRAS